MKAVAVLLASSIAVAPATLSGQAPRARSHRHVATASGSIATRGNMGLTGAQIVELQNALNRDGCSAGAADGVMGPRTRRALACARQKNNVTGSNVNDVLRSLNVGFTVEDSTGMGVVERRGRNQRASRAAARGADTTSAEWKNQELHRDSVRTRARATGHASFHRDSTSAAHARSGRANRGKGDDTP